MSGVGFKAVVAGVATGTSAKTLMQIVAASNHRVLAKEIGVAFQGTSNSAAPILVEVLRQSDAGTMSALTPVKANDSDDETLEVTAQHTATAEPTPGDVIFKQYVHPQSGFYWQAPFGGEQAIKGGGRLGIRVTAGADVNAAVTFVGEE